MTKRKSKFGHYKKSHVRIYEKDSNGKKYSRPATYAEEMKIKYGIIGSFIVLIRAIIAVIIGYGIAEAFEAPLWGCILAAIILFMTMWTDG